MELNAMGIIEKTRSNRTFMELKWYYFFEVDRKDFSSNRTFMELKCGIDRDKLLVLIVLIVPLWN